MERGKIIDGTVLIILLSVLIAIAYHYRKPGSCSIDPVLEKLKKDAVKIDPRAERLQFFPADESYTEDKQKVFICLKDENGQYFPYNELVQVVAHELAHALSPVIDKEHKTPEFNNLHNQLRERAIVLGLFNPGQPVPPSYCPKK